MFNLKKISAAALLTLPLAFGSMTAVADDDFIGYSHMDYDDRIEAQIVEDPNYPSVRQKAVNLLKKRGYRVMDIDPDEYMGKPSLDIEARKGRRDYDIVLSYPDLKILKERLDD